MHPMYKQKTYRCDAMAVLPAFRNLMLLHVDYLRNHPETKVVPIDVAKRNLNLYDLYRYLSDKNYPEELHWVILLVNDLNSHIDLDHTVQELVFPDANVVQTILATSGI